MVKYYDTFPTTTKFCGCLPKPKPTDRPDFLDDPIFFSPQNTKPFKHRKAKKKNEKMKRREKKNQTQTDQNK